MKSDRPAGDRHAGMPAIVAGLKGVGNARRMAAQLTRFGCEPIYVLLASEAGDVLLPSNQVLIKLSDPLRPTCLVEAVLSAKVGADPVPFLCTNDNLMFTYLEARRLLKWDDGIFQVPAEGILRARIKPAARRRWQRGRIERVNFAVLRDQSVEAALEAAGMSVEATVVVKPIAGTASEFVAFAVGGDEIRAQVERIRKAYAPMRASAAPQTVEVDGETYRLYHDILLEEALSGEECTIDGFSRDGQVSFTLQHKESVRLGSFIGDGLITCPSERPLAPISALDRFVKGALHEIGLHNWVFHAEARLAGDKLSFIELNARPPGGLLWMTAGKHLGIDPFEAMVRAHLGEPCCSGPSFGSVTGQFAIYGEPNRVIREIVGVESARKLRWVEEIEVEASPGTIFRSAHVENYVALVAIVAPDHEAVRRTESAVRSELRVFYG